MATPAGLAYALSQGRWKPYPYLKRLSVWLMEATLGVRRRIIVSLPPRHGKSELISRWFPVWALNHRPDLRIALCSFGAALAAEHGGWVRDTIAAHADRLRVRLKPGSKAASAWKTTAGGGMVSVGVGGPLTGKGFNIGIVDDPIKNRQESDSETVRRAVRNWYTSTFYTRQEPGASIVVLMTRWHEDDLAGWLLEEARQGGERWDLLSLPARAEENDPLGRRVGEALCPWRYNEDDLREKERAVGSRDWAALYQQRPSPDEGEIFRRAWWQRWRVLPPRFDSLVLSVDCAFKDLRSSDYVVVQVWGRVGASFHLVDQVRDRMSFTATVNAVRAMAAKWPLASAKLIEDKANGSAVIDTLRKEIPGLLPVEPHGGKVARAWAVQPYIEARNVWIPEDAAFPWVGHFVEEAACFPNGAHDDQVDTMTQALTYLAGRGGAPTARMYGSTEDWSARRG